MTQEKLVLVGVRDPMYRKIVMDAVRAQLPNNEVLDCSRLKAFHLELVRRVHPKPILIADEQVLMRFRKPWCKGQILVADSSRGDFSRVIVCVSTDRRYAELVNFRESACRFSSFANDFASLLNQKSVSQASS